MSDIIYLDKDEEKKLLEETDIYFNGFFAGKKQALKGLKKQVELGRVILILNYCVVEDV